MMCTVDDVHAGVSDVMSGEPPSSSTVASENTAMDGMSFEKCSERSLTMVRSTTNGV